MLSLLNTGPASATHRLVLAHGAGAAMDSLFMEQMCALLAARGIAVTRFEFAYMAARRSSGSKRPPPRAEMLISEYRAVVDALPETGAPSTRLAIGGKSLGGRVASMIAGALHDSGRIHALVCLGYPFHPPARPERTRTQHLADLTCPMLIVQGERDPFGSRPEVATYDLSRRIRLHWLPDGDHDLSPRKSSGVTQRDNLSNAADAIARFLEAQAGTPSG